MSDALIAAVAAFGVSEATGVTNVTGLGSSGDGDGDETPGFSAGGGPPAFAGLAEAFGAVSDLGERAGQGAAFAERAGQTAALVEQMNSLDPAQAGETVVNVVDTAGDGVREGFGDRVDRGTPDIVTDPRPDRGGDGGGGPGVLDVLADPEPFVQDTSESYGGAIGSIPFGLVEGAWSRGEQAGIGSRKKLQEITGIEPRGTGPNDDKPGIGVTDVLDAVAAGEQDGRSSDETYTPTEIPGAAYADLKDRVSSFEQDRPKSLAERGRDLVGADAGPTGSTRDDLTSSSSSGSGGGSSSTTPDFATSDSGTFDMSDALGDDQPGGGGSPAEDEEEELPYVGSGSASNTGLVR